MKLLKKNVSFRKYRTLDVVLNKPAPMYRQYGACVKDIYFTLLFD